MLKRQLEYFSSVRTGVFLVISDIYINHFTTSIEFSFIKKKQTNKKNSSKQTNKPLHNFEFGVQQKVFCIQIFPQQALYHKLTDISFLAGSFVQVFSLNPKATAASPRFLND